jgi:hypothetical protein
MSKLDNGHRACLVFDPADAVYERKDGFTVICFDGHEITYTFVGDPANG